VARNERVLGVASVAAPIRDQDGYPRAVLLVSGIDSAFTDDQVATLIRLTTLAARSVEEQLHGPRRPLRSSPPRQDG
jgi:DNA-binding IclR family transcriptional regulator